MTKPRVDVSAACDIMNPVCLHQPCCSHGMKPKKPTHVHVNWVKWCVFSAVGPWIWSVPSADTWPACVSDPASVGGRRLNLGLLSELQAVSHSHRLENMWYYLQPEMEDGNESRSMWNKTRGCSERSRNEKHCWGNWSAGSHASFWKLELSITTREKY